jgi:hypothetical protein
MHDLITWFFIHTGTYNESGPYYGFFSGFGSDIAEIAIIGGLISIYRKHNCHLPGCWRIAHHTFKDQVDHTEYKLCKKHYRAIHPETPKVLTLEHLAFIHQRNKKNQDYER